MYQSGSRMTQRMVLISWSDYQLFKEKADLTRTKSSKTKNKVLSGAGAETPPPSTKKKILSGVGAGAETPPSSEQQIESHKDLTPTPSPRINTQPPPGTPARTWLVWE